MSIIKTKLSPESVKLYEKSSGFETTDEVYLHTWDKIMDDLFKVKE